MAEHKNLTAGFQLAEWLVKPEDGSISSSSGSRRLEPLLMNLLVVLCSRGGQVVSKEELIDQVWGGRFVSDDTVKGSLYQLRKALGDDPRQPRFIETLPKRGYRILPALQVLGPGKGASAPDTDVLFVKGEAALSEQPSAASLKQARLYFERAIEAQPGHARAWSALAHTYVLMLTLGLGPGSELLPQAKAAALRSLELGANLSAAHVALGVAQALYQHDLGAAEKEFRLAIELAPADPLGHRWLARLLSCCGRHHEAVEECRRALQPDPLSLLGRREMIDVLFLAHRYDDVLAETGQLAAIGAFTPEVQLGLVWVYFLQNDEPKAMALLTAGLHALGVGKEMLDHARRSFEAGGMRAVFRLWAALLEQQVAVGRKNVDLPALYALLGDNERCLDHLEAIAAEGHPYLLTIPVSPFYDQLRSHPRYAKLVARLGLPATAS